MIQRPSTEQRRAAAYDFGFLEGHFDVLSSRSTNLLDPASTWTDTRATAVAHNYLDGLVSIDETWFPDACKFGMSLRVCDIRAESWTVYWLDSDARTLQSPVSGVWEGDGCRLTGPASVGGHSYDFSYEWSDVAADSATWQQRISFDGEDTWAPTWRMTWVRSNTPPGHHGRIEPNDDFRFLLGEWAVTHNRKPAPITRPDHWIAFQGRQCGRAYFDGAVSVDELELDDGQRGLTFRIYNDKTDLWSIYWIHSRGGGLQTPVHGRFRDGIGRFFSQEEIDGQRVDVRFVWDEIDATSAHWTQSFSFDRASTWHLNWDMRLERIGRADPESTR